MVDNPFAALVPGSAPAAAPPDDNPFAALAPQGAESDETTATQIGRGVLAAPVSLAQGLFEFGAAGVDAAFDTSYSKGVTEKFEGFKDYIGATPTSTAGKVAEELVAFGLGFVPIAGWLGRASAVAKGAKVGKARNAYQRSADIFGKSDVGKTLVGSRARLAATTALSVGAFEGVFSDDGRRTVSDHFAVLPEALRTDDTEYLTGAEEGYRRLQNRVRFFTEGVAIGALAEAIGPAVAATTRGVASVPGARSAARLVNEVVFKRLGQNFIGKSSFIRNNLTTAGATPEPVFEALVDTGLISRAKAQTAVRLWQNFDNSLLKTMNGMKMFGRGRVKVQKGYDDVMQFLSGNRSALDGYDQSVIKAADDMRVYLDDLSAEMYDLVKTMTPTARFEDGVKIGTGITREEIDTLLREFEKNKGSYIRRRYEAFLNPGKYLDPKMYKGPEFQAAVTDVARIMRLASEPSAQLSDDVLNTRAEEVILEMITGARRSESRLSTEDFLAAVKSGLESKRPAGGRVPIYGLSDRIFRERTDLLNRSVPLRKFLGEIRDPQQAFMQTVSAMADVEARYSLYSNMRNAFVKDFSDAAGKTIDQAPLIVSGGSIATKDQENLLTAMGYVKLGDEANLLGGTYGQMTGDFVKPEIYNALTIQGRTQNAWNEVYAVAMQAKGLSQMAKTALNFPLGTIRNFMSGIFMTGANGNIPKNFDFHEALQLTFGSMADLSDDAFRARWEKVRRLGLADEDLDIALVRELLQEGTREGDNLAFAAKLQGWIDKGLNVLPFVRRLENLYAGTDTFWKVFSHTAETGKLSSALRRAGLDESDVALLYDDLVRQGLAKDVSARSLDDVSLLDVLAADIVKATMPTYSRVPNFVRTIRRIPVTGNFIAFPAEIIRTSGNILQRSLSEMSFVADDTVLAKLTQKLGADAAPAAAKELQRQIRAIGSQRLSSYVSSAAAVPFAMQKAAMHATGTTEQDLEDLQKLTADFYNGHVLLPLNNARDDGGEQEFLDLSFLLPYDYLLTPARAALEAYNEKGEITPSETSRIMSAAWAGLVGYAEPFGSESLVAERLQDVLPLEWFGRGGRTQTGSFIYRSGENAGDVYLKSFNHVIGGFMPGAVENIIQERGGEWTHGRAARAFLGIPGRQGEQHNQYEELVTAISGARPMLLDLPKTFYFAGQEYNNTRSGLRAQFSSIVRRNDTTPERTAEAYADVLQDIYRQQSVLYSKVQSAERLGLSRPEIIRALTREANIGRKEAVAIVNGRSYVAGISQDLAKDIALEGRRQDRVMPRLDRASLRELEAPYRNVPLNPALDVRPESKKGFLSGPWGETLPPEAAAPAAPAPAGPSNPFAALVPQAPATPAPPQALAPSAGPSNPFAALVPQAPPSPALLGSNPVDAGKNAEIAQRLQGQ